MRKLPVALLLGVVTAFSGALLAGAPAQAARYLPSPSTDSFFVAYLCDGNGSGSCKSLQPGATPTSTTPIFAIGESSGAWRWRVVTVSFVNNNTFTDGFIDNALINQPIYELQLYAKDTLCNGNSAGGDELKNCDGSASELWVRDPSNGYFVNVGRSNDQDNWEVLCNPGTGNPPNPLIITTRDACTTYHEEWNFS